MDLERRADDEQEPRAACELVGAVDPLWRQQLAEGDDIRLHDLATRRARWRLLRLGEQLQHARQLIAAAAAGTGRGANRPVHLHDGLASGPLVQEIDVLRDDGLDEAEPLELREGGVSGIRLSLRQRHDARLVEAPDLERVAPERFDRAILERVERRPEPGRRAEVRDAALRAHACPREDDARSPLPNQLRKLARGHPPIVESSAPWIPTSSPRCVCASPRPTRKASPTTPSTSSGSSSPESTTSPDSAAATRNCGPRGSRR